MEGKILGKPSYSTLHIKLNNQEQIKAEPGSMIAMEPTATIEGKMNGGFLKGLKNQLLNGESFFISTITATKDDSDIYLAPKSVGDIEVLNLDGTKNWIVQGGSFLACTSGITTDTKFAGLKGIVGGEGLFMIKVSGKGTCFVSSFGAIIEYNLTEGNPFIVDNSHIVAFEDSLSYQIKKSGKGLLNMVKTGEGLVCEFSGSGKLYIQSRNLESFASSLNPFMLNQNKPAGIAGFLGNIFGG